MGFKYFFLEEEILDQGLWVENWRRALGLAGLKMIVIKLYF